MSTPLDQVYNKKKYTSSVSYSSGERVLLVFFFCSHQFSVVVLIDCYFRDDFVVRGEQSIPLSPSSKCLFLVLEPLFLFHTKFSDGMVNELIAGSDVSYCFSMRVRDGNKQSDKNNKHISILSVRRRASRFLWWCR
jgi:hypothetical protein